MDALRLAALVRTGWARRLTLVLLVASCGLLSAAARSSEASPGELNVLVTGNCFAKAVTPLATAIQAYSGVSMVKTFDTSTGTPTAATLAAQDLVVSLGDDCNPYANQATWGNRLADYVDGGGVVFQAAYDNWNAADAHPTGRFASGGYAPLEFGPDDNVAESAVSMRVHSYILLGLGAAFVSSDNTTTALAPGATLLMKWADGRNAIAIKGRVVATSASADDAATIHDLALMAVNAGWYLGPHSVVVTKGGTGMGTVTSTPAGISCGTTCAMPVAFGDSVTLTATAAPGSIFTGWASDGCQGTGTCTVTPWGFDTGATAWFDAAPDARISKANISSKKRRATFEFEAIDTASDFQCELRRMNSHKAGFKTCRPPKTYRHLKPGKYTFEVTAISPGGADPFAAKKSFKIKP